MLTNYMKSAFRNIQRYKLQTVVHVFGLSIGLAFFIVAFLYIWNENQFDKFHEHKDSVYRVYRTEEYKERAYVDFSSEYPLGPTLASEIEDIEFVRISSSTHIEFQLKIDEQSFYEPVAFVDAAFFDFFSFPSVYGNARTALKDKSSIVISERMAKKIFGTTNATGRTLSIRQPWKDDFQDLKIAAVVKNAPSYSTLQHNIYLPIAAAEELARARMNDWYANGDVHTFIKTNQQPQHIEKLLPSVVSTHLNMPWHRGKITLYLQPLTDIHANKTLAIESPYHKPENFSAILLAIALTILAVACTNFINIAIARGTTRATEISIRKTIGASQQQIGKQFFAEFLFLFGSSFVIAMLLSAILLPFLNNLTHSQLSLALLAQINSLPLLLLSVFAVCAVASLYPLAALSSIQVIDIQKTKLQIGHKNGLRKGLIVFQFIAAVALIFSTCVMLAQLNYIKNRDLGFVQDDVIQISTLHLPPESQAQITPFRNKLEQRHDVLRTSSVGDMSKSLRAGGTITDKNGEKLEFPMCYVDEKFIELLDIPLLQGRNFLKGRTSDIGQTVIINETLANLASDSPMLNETLYFTSPNSFGDPSTYKYYEIKDTQVIGIIQDYHFEKLDKELGPLALIYNPFNSGDQLFIKLNTHNLSETLAGIEATWKEFMTDTPFSFTFLDKALEQQYRQEMLWSRFINLASVMVIIIASLGVLGLVSLSLIRRTKEIGIRKVNGAGVKQILLLLNQEQILLIAIALLIAWPIGWFVMDKWLQNFAYHIHMQWWMFMVSGLIALTIALLTTGVQTLKAATANPVDALRYE